MTRTRCDRTAAWGALQGVFKTSGCDFDLRVAFADDAGRFETFSQSAPHVFADLSKNLIDRATQQLLFDLARECGVEQHRDAMFAGQAINNTEQRAVLHWLLRSPPQTTLAGAQAVTENIAIRGLESEWAQVHAILYAMLVFAE